MHAVRMTELRKIRPQGKKEGVCEGRGVGRGRGGRHLPSESRGVALRAEAVSVDTPRLVQPEAREAERLEHLVGSARL